MSTLRVTLDIADSRALDHRGLQGKIALGHSKGKVLLATDTKRLAWSEAALHCTGSAPRFKDTLDTELQSTDGCTYHCL